MKEAWMIPALLLLAGCFVLLLLLLRRQRTQQMASGSMEARLKTLEDLLRNAEKSSAALQGRQDILAKSVETSLSRLQTQQADAAMQTEQKLEQLRRSMTESLNHMQTASQLQLDGIRRTVDEKLQETLDRKLSESFQQVSQRLEAVYKGLGEMQSLAAGVGDLKKVLSNVKTRGILGEIQLGAILEQILSPEQYAANVATKKGSQANVEYAVRLPGSDGRPVWLPVDAKFPLDAYQQLLDAIDAVNADSTVHGCLLLRPLPPHLRDAEPEICDRLLPEKDVDGMTGTSAAGVYLGRPLGFAPCTAEAVTVLLEHYGVACAGKRAVVIGRSPVVGRPAAMLLLARNATVTVCHTATADLPAVTREADIIVSAAGAAGSLTVSHVRPGQTVIDVSVSWDAARNAMVGDAEFDAVSAVVDAITPVPGGVGTVTSAVLMRHVVLAAERGRK